MALLVVLRIGSVGGNRFKNGSTLGLRLGINPESHPWADAADGARGAR